MRVACHHVAAYYRARRSRARPVTALLPAGPSLVARRGQEGTLPWSHISRCQEHFAAPTTYDIVVGHVALFRRCCGVVWRGVV